MISVSTAVPQPPRPLRTAAAGAALAGLVVTLVYLPVLHHGFVFDDWSFLVNTPVYTEPARWREALLRSATGDVIMLRPVAMLSYMLPMWAGRTDAAMHHAVNLGFHAANTALVALLAWRWLEASFVRAQTALGASMLCALAYGLHGGLTEPVAWLSCRYDLMMAFFLFAALLLDSQPGERDWRRAGVLAALFLAALLSKETAVGFLAALPLAHLAAHGTDGNVASLRETVARAWRVHWRSYLALLAGFAGFLLLRFALIDHSLGLSRFVGGVAGLNAPGERALVVAATLSQHLLDALWPFTDIAPSRSVAVPMAIASALPILAFAILVLALAALAALRSPGWRRPFWLLAAFLGALLPVSNLMPVPAFWGEVAMASRYLTFPLVFVCLASGVALCRLGQSVLARHAAVPWIGVIGWIVASAGVVHASIPVWKDDGALFRVAIERASPHTLPFLLLNVGAHHARLGEWESAREAFDIALQQRPPASVASVLWYSLGNVEQRSGRNTEAVAAFIRAMSIDPGNVLARVGLARTERARDNPAGAIAALEPAVRHADASGRRIQNEDAARLQLGLAYADAGRATEAIAQIERARALTQAGDLRVEADAALASLRQSGR